MNRWMGAAAAMAALALLAALYGWASRFDPATAAAASPSEDPVVSATECVTVARSAGKQLWRVAYDGLRLRPSEGDLAAGVGRAEMRGLKHGQLNTEEGSAMGLTAASALYDAGAGRLQVKGPLTLRTGRDERLRAAQCTWSRRDSLVTFPQGATVHSGDAVATAPFALYSVAQRRVDCPEGAAFRSPHAVVEAASLYWDMNARRLDLPGAVTGRYGAWRFAAQGAWLDLAADRLHANEGRLEARIATEEPREP